MPVSLLASACPAVQVAASFKRRVDAYTNGTVPSARSFAIGDTDGVAARLNENALIGDLAFRYGGSLVRAIGQGLTITYSGSYQIAVAAGHAVIDGLVELSVAATGVSGLVVGTNYIWISQTGTIQVASTTAAPSSTSCYLGAVIVASGGGSATIDTSGVCYAGSGMITRQTADTNAPSDSPSAAVRLLTKTLRGDFLWNGSAWLRVGELSAIGETPTGTVDGSNTVFTLANAPVGGKVAVYTAASGTDLTRLVPTAYSVTGSTLTFTSAPATGSIILVDYRY